MLTRIFTFYCFCDDLLKAIEYGDDKQVEMTTAEVMTVAFVAAEFFGGCFEKARKMLMEHGYISRSLLILDSSLRILFLHARTSTFRINPR